MSSSTKICGFKLHNAHKRSAWQDCYISFVAKKWNGLFFIPSIAFIFLKSAIHLVGQGQNIDHVCMLLILTLNLQCIWSDKPALEILWKTEEGEFVSRL